MEVPNVSSNFALSTPNTARAQARRTVIRDLYDGPKALPKVLTPAPAPAPVAEQALAKPKRNWREELDGAWYVTKLMTLSALSNAIATVGDGWDWLRAKLSRSEAN